MNKKHFSIIFLSITSMLVIAGGFWFTDVYIGAKSVSLDLDADGIMEKYELKGGVFSIREGKTKIWSSPQDWVIQTFAIGDIDNDGHENILLSVWKPGNYGPSQPFWVKENDMSIRNHLFVYELRNNSMHSVWQSSNVVRPNCTIEIIDTNSDGSTELVVGEGDYNKNDACEDMEVAVWKWSGWGFTKIDE